MKRKVNYIGVYREEDEKSFVIGYDVTSDLKLLKDWKKTMDDCDEIGDCKIYKLTEVKGG